MNRSSFRYIVIPGLLCLVWFLVTALKLISPLFLPTIPDVLQAFLVSVRDHSLIGDLLATLGRMSLAFVFAILIGTPIGLLMGYSSKVYGYLEFLVEFFRSIPTTALFPLFLLVFGVGDEAKVAVAVWGASLIIIVNAMHGVHQSKELRLRAAKIMRILGLRLFTQVIFPEALPQIITGYRIALSLSLVIVVVTEMFIGTMHGLGHRVIDAQLVYNIPDMYMAIVVTGLVGFILNKGLLLAEEKIVHWRGK